jgi:hypothetical protein
MSHAAGKIVKEKEKVAMKSKLQSNLFKITAVVLPTTLALVVYLAWSGLSPALAWFDEPIRGRMTGGGSVCRPSGCVDTGGEVKGRITHGFELHCVPSDGANNLEINDHTNGSHRFHLESLLTAECTDDPSIRPKPPNAPFDTYLGLGTGRYDGAANFCAVWKFTDAGERGDNDTAWIKVTDGSPVTNDCDGTTVLLIGPANLTFGNHQAHKETGQ